MRGAGELICDFVARRWFIGTWNFTTVVKYSRRIGARAADGAFENYQNEKERLLWRQAVNLAPTNMELSQLFIMCQEKPNILWLAAGGPL
jgi:hypothetical protein